MFTAFVRSVSITLLLAASGVVRADISYRAQELPRPAYFEYAVPRDINNLNQIVGYASYHEPAWAARIGYGVYWASPTSVASLTDRDGFANGLAWSGVQSINNNGVMVGEVRYSNESNTRMGVWRNGAWVLGTMFQDAQSSAQTIATRGFGVNDRNEIVGQVEANDGSGWSFLFNRFGYFNDVRMIPYGVKGRPSRARAISNNGTIVGDIDGSSYTFEAYTYFYRRSAFLTIADINADGVYVAEYPTGQCAVINANGSGFLFNAGANLKCVPQAINRKRAVVGQYYWYDWTPFVYSDNAAPGFTGFRHLNSITSFSEPGHWLTHAYGINDNGFIVAVGHRSGDLTGTARAYLLTPVITP